VNDWPSMGQNLNEVGIGEPVSVYRKPDVGRSHPTAAPASSDEFESAQPGLQWQWQANPVPSWYSLTAREHHIRLYAERLPEGISTLYDAPNLFMQKFSAPAFSTTTKFTLRSGSPDDLAGLIVFGENYQYVAVSKVNDEEYRLRLVTGAPTDSGRAERELESVRLLSDGTVYLQVDVSSDGKCSFGYSLNEINYEKMGGNSFTATPGKWVGAKIGIFAINIDSEFSGGYADFDWFRMK
jgi:beta-xylosidase